MSTEYYGLVRIDFCPGNPWREDVSIDVRNDGALHEFEFTDYFTEEALAYIDDEEYVANCKLRRNRLSLAQDSSSLAEAYDASSETVYSFISNDKFFVNT